MTTDGDSALPPGWIEIIRTREKLATIETKLDLALGQFPLFSAKLDTLEAKLYAAEQRGAAHKADIDAVRAENLLLKQTMDAYELPPPFFKAWKSRVDAVVTAFEKNTLVVAAQRELRKRDVALISGIAGGIGFLFGTLPNVSHIVDIITGA